MFPAISALTIFFKLNPELDLLISRVQESNDNFWLVGGCLRSFLLDLPQTDIDIACSGDPTTLARSWSSEVSGRWFCLDAKRRQSRVLLQNGLTLDFTPLRAPSIIEDLQLRDFTINALALPLNRSFPESELLDPLSGINHLQQKQLNMCSPHGFSDDPLRMLKGIRHAVTLGFVLSTETQKIIAASRNQLDKVAGERINDEWSKILGAEDGARGVELLIDTGVIGVLLGPAGDDWNRQTTVSEIRDLSTKIQASGLMAEERLSGVGNNDQFSLRAVFLFARLLQRYTPQQLSSLLHERFRLSRHLQQLLENLQSEPDDELFSLIDSIDGQRRQALLVEKIGPFACEKMLYWGVCRGRLELKQVVELQQSFSAEQQLGRIPDLLNGKRIAALLKDSPDTQIGELQKKLKLAEIKGEIRTSVDAERWLRRKLSVTFHHHY